MKNFNLVIKMPIDLYKSDNNEEILDHKDIEDLYNSHKHILIDLLENLIINSNQEYKVIIEKIQKEET